MVGVREPEIYGEQSFEEIIPTFKEKYPNLIIEYFQSNHEGALIDYIHSIGFSDNTAAILNAGAYTHTSIALRDAVAAVSTPFVEVHISDISTREKFRQFSYLSDVCIHHIIGKGMLGYEEAISFLSDRLLKS